MADRPQARSAPGTRWCRAAKARFRASTARSTDCIARLPDIAALGFDVLYLTPIHPIGRINRKGRNNALTANQDDPGSPYAIGAAEGGHDAVHPELGTLDDFRGLVAACHEHGMEVALDFAVQCSPDHPWLKEHPQWFRRRPDGSIRYAENPPKKYEDIVNPDFYCADAQRAVECAARRRSVLGRSGRADLPGRQSPHQAVSVLGMADPRGAAAHPDVIFLSEAFTRPKVMKGLAKLGFTQSYTYFTWRTHEGAASNISASSRLSRARLLPAEFLRQHAGYPALHLQSGEPWMFKSRVALAATLSATTASITASSCSSTSRSRAGKNISIPRNTRSRSRDWDKPGNIKDYIGGSTGAARNAALQQTGNLHFLAR